MVYKQAVGIISRGLAALGLSAALGCSAPKAADEDATSALDGGVTALGSQVSPPGASALVSPKPSALPSTSTVSTDAPPEIPDVFADGTPVTNDTPGQVLPDCAEPDAVRPLLKLSTLQYRNSVRDLLSALGVPEVAPLVASELQSIPDDSRSQLFSGLDGRISIEHLEGYFNVAKAVAEAITGDDARLATVAGDCAVSAVPEDDCFEQFVERFGKLSYRRQLTEPDRAALLGFRDGQDSAREQWRAIIVGGLVSPRFVNHVEVDGAWESDRDRSLRLTAYEVAVRLSYTFWQTLPDAQLFAAAQDGSLLSESGVQRELDRMFADPRTQETLWMFWREWLGLDNFTGFELGRPGFQALAAGTLVDENTYTDMIDELRLLTTHFTFDAPGPLRALLNTNLSVTQSAALAGLYGVEPWSGSGAFPTLDSRRGGLFQRAALLVSSLEQTNPFHRGAFVKRSLLCENLPPPDPAALPPGSLDIPPTTALLTTRQRFENKIRDNELCTGCHGLFSEVGYALEAFDSLGRLRTAERIYDEQTGELLAELPLNTLVNLTVGGTTLAVANPADLNQLLMDHGNIGDCLASQYLRYTQRHAVDAASSDRCISRAIGASAEGTQSGLLGAFRSVAEYQAFFRRKVGAQ